MKRIVWNALKSFRCVAGQCTDSCCKDWAVDVDSNTAQHYLALDGALGARTAYLSRGYGDDPENRGLSIFTQEEFDGKKQQLLFGK